MLQNFFQDPELIYGNIITQDLEDAAEDVYGEELDWYFHQQGYNPPPPTAQRTTNLELERTRGIRLFN